MEILLVSPSVKLRSSHDYLNPSLGLAYIASILTKNGYEVSVVDYNVTNFNPILFERILLREKPRILGISCYTETYLNGLLIAGEAKRLLPDIIVVMGGPHPTTMYKQVASENNINVVVLGEGEITTLAFPHVTA